MRVTVAHGLRSGRTDCANHDLFGLTAAGVRTVHGLCREVLEKPIAGIAMTPSGFSNCHHTMPELVEAVGAARARSSVGERSRKRLDSQTLTNRRIFGLAVQSVSTRQTGYPCT